MQKVVHIPRSALMVHKLCSKDKKDVQRSSVHIDGGAVVATNGVATVAAQINNPEGVRVSINADDIRRVINVKSDALDISQIDENVVLVGAQELNQNHLTDLPRQRTNITGWQKLFKKYWGGTRFCIGIDDMVVLLNAMKSAAELKGNTSGMGFGVFVGICSDEKGETYLELKLKNVQHGGSVFGIIKTLSVLDEEYQNFNWKPE